MNNVVETDLLVIGGGIAGCFAALRGREMLKKVTLLEKATIRRGGSVGPGMDHMSAGIGAPIPGTPTLEDALASEGQSSLPSFGDPNVGLRTAVGMYDRVLDFEKFGVKIRENDGSYTTIWPKERGTFSCLSVRGEDFKTKLGEAVHKTEINIIERTMAVDLLTHDGAVTGAVAVNIRNGQTTIFRAKAVVLATGVSGRVYIPQDGLFLTYDSPANSGDGHAMAYRAGAELINMEFGYIDYTSLRDGGGVFGLMPFEWLPYLVNQKGEKLIETEEDSRNRIELMIKEIKEGRGPLYWDCRHLPEEAFRIIERNIAHEYPITQKWYKQRGIDIRKDLVPIQLTPCSFGGGLQVNENFNTSLKGLYAAGEETPYTHSLAGAAASGHMAAENAANDALKTDAPEIEEEQVQEIASKIEAPLRRKEGMKPIEMEEMARAITTDYVGFERSGLVMEKGLELIMEMREKYIPLLHAKNSHEEMRCLEVQNIIDNIEMHIRASLMRKESRFVKRGNVSFWHHIRLDYPQTEPAWAKLITIRKEKGEVNLYTKEIPSLKESLVQELKDKIKRRGN